MIIDFPKYKGPYWCQEKPIWILIRPENGFCDYMCCARAGIPLMPGYSMPIAKSQGSTIGSKEQVTHLKLKLQKESNFETLCPGTTYTGLSRVDRNSSWALVEKIDWARLNTINNHSTIQKRCDEDERLTKRHKDTLSKFDTSKHEFLNLITEIDRFCNDGIYDSICNIQKDCSCIYCVILQCND